MGIINSRLEAFISVLSQVFAALRTSLVCDLMKQTQPWTSDSIRENTKLGGVAGAPNGCAAIERELSRLENLARRNFLNFKKGECSALYLGRNGPRPSAGLLKNCEMNLAPFL